MLLSNDPRSLKDRYGVIVVGSGYGGSIMAARLAQKGLSVCLLERGKEWAVGTFPDRVEDVVREVRTDRNPLGLFEYLAGDDQDVLVGNGLGGTSLINANVVIEPDDDVFRGPRWPSGIRQAFENGEMVETLKTVREMLQATSDGPKEGWPRKVQEMQQAAGQGGASFRTLEVAVNLRKFDGQPNSVGIVQRLCTSCGDCVTGCNIGAKNTLAMNYLPKAKAAGAEIYTRMEVDHVVAAPGGGYFVHVRHHGDGRSRELVLHGAGVVLAAGSLGSTGILLRSKAHGLPLSRRVGHHFSGNADTLGYGYNNDVRTDVLGFGNHRDERSGLAVGPTILSVLDFRNRQPMAKRFVIEEGAIPRALVDTLRHASFLLSGEDTDKGIGDKMRELKRIARDQFGYDPDGAANHSMVFLGMGHDGADGRVVLDSQGRPRILWNGLPGRPIFDDINTGMLGITKALGGTYVKNPRWSRAFGGNQITVHPLGGCPMGEDPDSGVVNHFGQVFQPEGGLHTGLFVVDGSILPSSVGVNPLLTISALAERSAAHLASGGPGALAPSKGPVAVGVPTALPLGLEFTERMVGYFSKGVTNAHTPPEYEAAAERGRKEKQALDVYLCILIDDLRRFVDERGHEAQAEGTVDGVAGRMCRVDEGRFHLFVDDAEQKTRRMLYRLTFLGEDGQPYLLEGFKEIRDDSGLDAWTDSTTLFVTIRKDWSSQGDVLGQGIIRITIPNLMKQLASIRVRNSTGVGASTRAIGTFGRFFFGALWDTYVRKHVPGLGEEQ